MQKVLLDAAIAVGLGLGSGHGSGGVIVKGGKGGQVELLKLAQGQNRVGAQVGGGQQGRRTAEQPPLVYRQSGLFNQQPRQNQR